MKKIIAFLLAVVMLLSLVACGGGEPDPNVGKYIGIKGEMMGIVLTMEELYPGESYLELKNGGKAELVLEGDKMNCKWTLDGETFNLKVEGEDSPGTLKDGIVTFDFAGTGIMLTFALEGVTLPEESTLEAGFYPLYAVNQDGEYTGNDIITMAGMDKTNYLLVYDDGTVDVVMDGETYFCMYRSDRFVDDEGFEIEYAIVDGFVEMYLEGNLTFIYQKGNMEDVPAVEQATLEAGFYPLYAVDQDGEYTGNDIITMAEMDKTNYLIVYGDGTVDIVMDGDTYFCTYTDDCFIDDEGYEIDYAIVDGLVEMYLEGNMTFFYTKGNMEDIPDVEPGAGALAFPDDVVEDFYGDWHGWCVIVYGTGSYESNVDSEFELLARYAFDENGNCTPWMAIYADPEDNFQNVELTYVESDGVAYLTGQLWGMEITSDSYMYESFGSLCLTMYLEGDDGTLQVVVCMRHPDDAWDAYDYPCMPDSAIKYYSGMSFEELVELYELDPADLPALS